MYNAKDDNDSNALRIKAEVYERKLLMGSYGRRERRVEEISREQLSGANE